jgi:hypothetical protein
MILVLFFRLMLFLTYQGIKMFGVFAVNAVIDAIFDRLENWSMNRAQPDIVIVQGV